MSRTELPLARRRLALLRVQHWLPAFVLLGFAIAGGCQKANKTATPAEKPAKVSGDVKEADLNTIQLTPEAVQRLGIVVVPVERKQLPRVRKFGGEVVVPPGSSVVVSAPFSAALQLADKDSPPLAGMKVTAGQKLFDLLPVLSPERDVLTPAERVRFAEAKNAVATARIDAENLVHQARVQVEAAQIAFDRAQRLLQDQAGTVRVVDESRAQLMIAQRNLDAAKSRQQLVDKMRLDEEAGEQRSMALEAPFAGILRSVSAAPGEIVAAGSPLFEVLDLSKVWIKVPVYGGEMGQIAQDQPAYISRLGAAVSEPELRAAPASAPPTALASASAVDLYFALANPQALLHPGQRVTARLALIGQEEGLAVPWKCVVYDIHGGSWVYEQIGENKFVRRRVQVKYVVDGWAALASGPAVGKLIVTDGAEELFGTEFFSK